MPATGLRTLAVTLDTRGFAATAHLNKFGQAVRADARRSLLMRWNLTTRVFASTAAIVTVVVGAAFVIGSASLRRASDDTARRRLEQAVDLVAQFLDGRQHSLAGGVRVFVQGAVFPDARR